jgi:hypothetical protein
MNILQWLTPLLKVGKKRRRSSGKGIIWASIISVVVSALALSRLNRGQIKMPDNPLNKIASPEKTMHNIQNFLSVNDRAVLAEFANEIAPKTNDLNNDVLAIEKTNSDEIKL